MQAAVADWVMDACAAVHIKYNLKCITWCICTIYSNASAETRCDESCFDN